MRNITKIFTLVLSLILLFAVSCSNDDKTGIKNNPPENDTEITDGETGSGSGSGSGSETGGSGTGGSGTGGDSGTETGGGSGTGTGGDSGTETGGGSGTGGDSGTETGGGSGTGGDSGTETGGGSGTGTGGDSGSGTGTGGSGEGGSGSGSGSGEGGSGEVTPPSETETTEEIYAKDFPTELLGRYKDDKLTSSGFSGYNFETEVSTITELGIQKTKIEGSWLKDGTTDATSRQVVTIEKWKQTKKGGNPIKLEGEFSDAGGGKYIITYDYASGTLSGTYTHPDGTWSFNGKK